MGRERVRHLRPADRHTNNGGLAISPGSTPWAAAFATDTITTPDAAQAALSTARALAGRTLPETTALLREVMARSGLAVPETVSGWIRALALLRDVAATLSLFDPALFGAALEQLAAELSPGSASPLARVWAQLTDGAYRRARKTALDWWRPSRKPAPAELHAAVVAAAERLSVWRRAATDGRGPRLPADLAGAEGAFSQLHAEMTDLARWACLSDIGQLPISGFQAQVQALLADTGTLYRLPELAGCGVRSAARVSGHCRSSARSRLPVPPRTAAKARTRPASL